MKDDGLRLEIEALLELARRLAPEGERLDLTDREYTKAELVELRSRLSMMRKSIDVVNNGLANYWDEEYGNEEFDAGANIWYVGKTKQKMVSDGDMLLEWLATLDKDRLTKLVNPNRLIGIIKVSGMSPAERDTHLIEDYSPNAGISIKSKEKK